MGEIDWLIRGGSQSGRGGPTMKLDWGRLRLWCLSRGRPDPVDSLVDLTPATERRIRAALLIARQVRDQRLNSIHAGSQPT